MTPYSSKTRKTGLLLIAGALFAVIVAAPARAGFAQSSGVDTNSRLNQLENQVQTLSRSVYRGTPPPTGDAAPASGESSAIANFEARVSAIEGQERAMTGQLEQVMHQVQDLQAHLDKIQADYDLRLQQLEHGGGDSSGTVYVPPSYNSYNQHAAASAGASTPDIAKGGQNLGTLSSAAADTPEALYESAFADIRDSKYDAAETKFKQFLTRYSGNALSGNAQYWLGETYYVRGDYKQSAKTFAQGYQDYPQGSKAADSLLKLGLSLSKLGKKEDACLSFHQLKKEFPGDTIPANRRAAQEMKQLGCQ